MKKILSALKPEPVFRHFEAITRIPHGSGNTKEIAGYCKKTAETAGCKVIQDRLNNLIITIPPSTGYENSPAVILQGHLDMVCDKFPGIRHDFSKDPIPLEIDNDWIRTKGTTLGGDDGIAMAVILAIAEDRALKHGKIYGVLTADEETGMLGAKALNCSALSDAAYLINIDSETEEEIVAGCAGGITVQTAYPLHFKKAKGLIAQLTLNGLDGGHSGEMIHRCGFNANTLIGEILNKLDQKLNLSIISLKGGEQDNVIPKSAAAEILIGENQKESLLQMTAELEKNLKLAGGRNDQNLTIDVDFGAVTETMTADRDSKRRMLFVLSNTPNGVQSFGRTIDGQTDTSLNLGILNTEDKKMNLCYLLRSSRIFTRTALVEKLTTFTEYLGGSVSVNGSYPPWEFKPDSRLRDLVLDRSQKLFGKQPRITTIHAGLECGIFAEKLPQADMISIGPDLKDIHTPCERLSIPSTGRIWQLIVSVLENLK